jgi:oligopeptide/dipeptide ABC transporter ATP-binding protein
VPIPNPDAKKKQIILTGDIPSPINPPKGCVFHTRCPEKFEPCDKEAPPQIELDNGQTCFCWLYAKQKEKKLAAI